MDEFHCYKNLGKQRQSSVIIYCNKLCNFTLPLIHPSIIPPSYSYLSHPHQYLSKRQVTGEKEREGCEVRSLFLKKNKTKQRFRNTAIKKKHCYISFVFVTLTQTTARIQVNQCSKQEQVWRVTQQHRHSVFSPPFHTDTNSALLLPLLSTYRLKYNVSPLLIVGFIQNSEAGSSRLDQNAKNRGEKEVKSGEKPLQKNENEKEWGARSREGEQKLYVNGKE